MKNRSGTLRAIASTSGCILLASMASLPSPTAAWAQEGGQSQMQKARQLQQQILQIDRQLQGIQQQALQDPALQARQAELQEMIMSAMQSVDPETETRQERLGEIQQELQTAQQNQDTSRIRNLMTEGQRLQQRLRQTQQQVMQRDSIAEELEAFRDPLLAKMKELDPNAARLIEKRDSLVSELESVTGGGPGAGN